MLPLIAIPVLHSSGAWIASTAASGYLAGTLSSSWVGAFILGNSGVLSSLGLVSASGVFAAGGGLAGMSAAAGGLTGAALSSVGLGGLAQSLGLLPATFLGLTPVGWAIAGGAALSLASVGVYIQKRYLSEINKERVAGGLEPFKGIGDIWREVKEFERTSMLEICRALSRERLNFKLRRSAGEVEIDGKKFDLKTLRYRVNKDGSEELWQIGRFLKQKCVFVIKKADLNLGDAGPAAT